MVSFTFSAEQIKTAPAEIRRWMETEIVRALTGAPAAINASHPPSPVGLERALAAGTALEMQETFNRIAGNAIMTRMFFELARDQGFSAQGMPFHVVNLADVMRHLQLAEAQHVLTGLDTINQAFQQARRDPQASLFALDEAGHIYLHELTYHAIRQVWQQLVIAHPWAITGQAETPVAAATATSGRQESKIEPTIEPIVRPEPAFAGTTID